MRKFSLRHKSKSVEDLINANTGFFQEIDAINEMQLGYLCYRIAITIWNENLDNDSAQIKNDIIYYLDSAEININKELQYYKTLLKGKTYIVDVEKQIQSLEETIRGILKLKKDAE